MSLAELYDLSQVDPADILTADPGEQIAAWARNRPEWMARAACRDENTDTFFPPTGHSVEDARRICESCPVLPACLRYALDAPDLQGVWAATTPKQRRAIRRAARTGT